MTEPTGLPLALTPAERIDRRAQWRMSPLLLFMGFLLALGAIAAASLVFTPPRIAGLPDDPDVRAARSLLFDHLRVDCDPLRFQSTLLGAGEHGHLYRAEDVSDVGRAEEALRRAASRHRGDPRLLVAFAALHLARREYPDAERGYRAAVDHGGRYGEARLGLGVVLAMRAEHEGDPRDQRALLLMSIAQLAAVDARDPMRDAAMYDRALLLERVGRRDEAKAIARSYLAHDANSSWAEALRRAVP